MEHIRLKILAYIFRSFLAKIYTRWRLRAKEEKLKDRIYRLRNHLQGATPERLNRKIEVEIVRPKAISRTKVQNYSRKKLRKPSNSYFENSRSPFRSENNSLFNCRVDPFGSGSKDRENSLAFKTLVDDTEEVAVVSSFHSMKEFPKYMQRN